MADKQADIRVKVVSDYDGKGIDRANTGLAGFRAAINDTDGIGNKFKAGWGSIKDTVTQHAAELSIAGGAALVAFGVKAVGAFTDTAKAAIDLGKATGLSTEAASRWIGVGKDFEVTAEDLTVGIGRVAKTLDSGKWEKYGIATRDAGGKARNTNDILEDAFVKLSSITDETERARAGNELFGKGYSKLAPLIGHTKDEYDKMLGSVEKGQVITESEAKSAEKMRLAEDNLKDALADVTLAVGALVAKLAPLLNVVAQGVTGIASMVDQIENMNTSIADSAMDDLNRQLKEMGAHLENGKAVLDATTKAVENAQNSSRGYSYALQDVTQSTEDQQAAEAAWKRANDSVTQSIKHNLEIIQGQWDELTGNIDADKTWLNLQNQFDDLAAKIGEQGAQSRDSQIATDDLKLSVIDYAKQVLGLPPERVTNIISQIDQGSFDQVQALLDALTRNRTMDISIVAKGGAGYGIGAHAAGGMIPRSEGVSLVGENGPELISAPGASVLNAGQTAAALGGSTYVTINMPVGSNGDDVIKAIQKWERRNGPGWRS